MIGGIDLSQTGIAVVLENLTVGSFFDLTKRRSRACQDNLFVRVYLILTDTVLTQIGRNLTVGQQSYPVGINALWSFFPG